jgi:predicted DNA-binding transcriptional regulator YafY
MPANKSALLRYRIIDGCLTNPNRRYPTMDFIIEKTEDQISTSLSKSMFTKDIENMRTVYGAPIQFDRTNKGYRYTEPEFSIKEFPLTHDEIEALDFSTALFHQLKGTRMFEQFENAINKVIEGYRISKIIGKSEKQILQVEEPLKTGGSLWLEIILRAIVEKDCLKITYQGFGKDKTVHEFSCYLLKEYRNRWYAVGYSKKTMNIVTLALDRIGNAERSKGTYISDHDFIPSDFFKYSFGITQVHSDVPHKIILSFSAEQAPYILSQPLHTSQIVILHNEQELQIQLKVYITQELKMAILSYGEKVKVLKPVILQNEIKTIIKKMKMLYE